MRIQQVILFACGLVAVALLFIFGRLRAPEKAELPAGSMTDTVTATATADFEEIQERAKKTLTTAQRDSIEILELQLQKIRGEKEQVAMLKALGEKWSQTGNIIVAGKYFANAAVIDGEENTWNEAATRFFMGFPTTIDTAAKVFAAGEAIKCYEQLRTIDSTNLTYPVKEAISYIDGLGQVMQGVVLLKEVEKKDPENKDMNLILGRLAVVSGQFDKAIARLEKLIEADSANAEAYFHLAEAYRAVGRKEDAIHALQQCKSLVKDPDFAAQIDLYINQIKNS